MTIGRQVTLIDVGEFDDLVMQTYGRPYCFQQQDGCKSRGTATFTVPLAHPYDFDQDIIPEEVNHHEMGVSFKAWLERDPKKKLESCDEWGRERGLGLWWERNFYPHMEMVVSDLHTKGILPAGDYVIDIDW